MRFVSRQKMRRNPLDLLMFLDTGIGGEGYAIIDQGGVEFVLSATPEQRREIFEEAAGVSKYKAKRDEAQKKLEKVDIDLSRLMDSVILIEEQIKKLDSEARKAKLYQKYREELQQAEVAVAVENIERAIQDINRDTVELTPVSQLLSDKSALVSQLEGEVAALNLNLTHTQSELAKFSEQIATVKYQIGLLEGNITNCDNMLLDAVPGIDVVLRNKTADRTSSKKNVMELRDWNTELHSAPALVAKRNAFSLGDITLDFDASEDGPQLSKVTDANSNDLLAESDLSNDYYRRLWKLLDNTFSSKDYLLPDHRRLYGTPAYTPEEYFTLAAEALRSAADAEAAFYRLRYNNLGGLGRPSESIITHWLAPDAPTHGHKPAAGRGLPRCKRKPYP